MLINCLKTRINTINVFDYLKALSVTMSKNNVKYYYGVGKGRRTGVFDSWPECKKQVEGIKNAKYKKFASYQDAEKFVKDYASPQKFEPPSKFQNQSLIQSPSVKQTLVSNNKSNAYFDLKKSDSVTQKVSYEYEPYFMGLGVPIKKEKEDETESGFIPLDTNGKVVLNTKKLTESMYYNCPKIDLKNVKSKPALSGLNLADLEKKLTQRKSLKKKDAEQFHDELEKLIHTNGIDNIHLIKTILAVINRSFKFKDQNVDSVPSTSTSHEIVSSNESSNIKNHSHVETLAANLRLDAFEKRFDELLKEVGALSSEVRELKKKNEEYAMALAAKTEKDTEKEKPRKKRKRSKSEEREQQGEQPSTSKGSTGGSTDDVVIKKEKIELLTFDVGTDDYVRVYTDGCCHNNGQPNARAGVGIWFGDNHPLNISKPLDGPATNNNGEIQAARMAIELAAEAGVTRLKIHTDSSFLINCATEWMRRWKLNGWKRADKQPVINRVELEKLDRAMNLISVKWEKVPAHVGVYGNEQADRLANEGALLYRPR